MNLASAKVLVTGGAGFIGGHIVESLVAQGAQVKVYDNFSSGTLDNLAAVRDSVEVIEGDILDAETLARAMRGCNVVSHQAAQLEITRCVDDPGFDLRVNTLGSLNVFAAAVKTGAETLINASSACVYGQAQSTPQTELHPQQPNWAYGVSKLAAEHYGRLYHDLHGLKTTSLRYAIIYGPREWYGRVLTIFLKRALQQRPPVIFGDGAQERDFTCVHDLVRLHNQCITSDVAAGEIFNVSTGVPTSIRRLAELVTEIARLPGEIIHESVAVGARSTIVEENRQRLPGELQQMVLSPEKARRMLDWTAGVALRQGLELELEWLRANAKRWSRMSY